MHKNQLFREIECGFSIETAAKLCFKSVSTVKGWDRGNPIPPECKRLMRLVSGRELAPSGGWEGFRMNNYRLELPNGQLVSPQQIMVGIALLEINSELEIKTSTKLLNIARILTNLKSC